MLETAPMVPTNGPGDAADVQLVDVSKSFGAVGAVHEVSLTIRRGEFFSFAGLFGVREDNLPAEERSREWNGTAPTSGRIKLAEGLANNPAYQPETIEQAVQLDWATLAVMDT